MVIFLLLITGCGSDRDPAGDHAYVRDGNGEEGAVDVLQAGSRYKIVGPMDDLKDAVVDILGENYWPDTYSLQRSWQSAQVFPKICMRIIWQNISIRRQVLI